MWIIENATSGAQSLSIKQGSGNEVTIANGKAIILYTDGAGATGAVNDALQFVDVGDGTVTQSISITVNLTGVQATGHVGGTSMWIEIVPSQTPNWVPMAA